MKCLDAIVIVFVAGIFGCIFAQDNLPSKDEVLEKVPGLANIPGIDNINASTIDDAKNVFKQKCEKNGGLAAYENAEKAQQNTMDCLKSLVNVTELQQEIENAKPTGDLDVVFKKYCRKSPTLKNCVMNFTQALEPCLEEKERENKKIIQNITESLLNFICFKEGDRIALFIAAGGPECFQSKQEAVQTCAKNVFGSYVPESKALPGIENLPSLVLDEKKCSDIAKLQQCVVRELEGCEDPTPGNIVDSLFNFIIKVTPCENLMSGKSDAIIGNNTRNSANAAAVSFLMSIVVGLTIRYV